MEKPKHSVRFEAIIGNDGKVTFSKKVHELGLKPGSVVTVNIFGGTISKQLKRLNVTDEEVELIGSRQFEARENVVAFLRSQGSLKRSGFMKK